MPDEPTNTQHTEKLIDGLERLRSGDSTARDDVIDHTCERMRLLARKMLRGFPTVRRWSETDDVLQNAMVRLHRSLAEVVPETPQAFYGLAATQIRRELIDLARSQRGPMGIGKNLDSDTKAVRHQTDGHQYVEQTEPETLEQWARFHQHIDGLPDEQRQVVDLVWYEGMTKVDAARVIGVSLATVKRRWQAAQLTLHQRLGNIDF